MIDPRREIINENLKNIKNIIAISSGKGGVGKSVIASTLALLLAKNKKVGLLDLDFTSPSTHVILGVNNVFPEEKNGLIPPKIFNLEYMSIIFYSSNKVSPLRGKEISNALIELLAITKWNTLDLLLIDMPPGISDATLDIMRLVKKIKFIIVTTSSLLSFETVRKLIDLLKSQKMPIIGIIENMKNGKSFIEKRVKEKGISYLGWIPFDPELEKWIGKVEKLLNTSFAKKLGKISEKLI